VFNFPEDADLEVVATGSVQLVNEAYKRLTAKSEEPTEETKAALENHRTVLFQSHRDIWLGIVHEQIERGDNVSDTPEAIAARRCGVQAFRDFDAADRKMESGRMNILRAYRHALTVGFGGEFIDTLAKMQSNVDVAQNDREICYNYLFNLWFGIASPDTNQKQKIREVGPVIWAMHEYPDLFKFGTDKDGNQTDEILVDVRLWEEEGEGFLPILNRKHGRSVSALAKLIKKNNATRFEPKKGAEPPSAVAVKVVDAEGNAKVPTRAQSLTHSTSVLANVDNIGQIKNETEREEMVTMVHQLIAIFGGPAEFAARFMPDVFTDAQIEEMATGTDK
jgi:hypothetical protein